MRARQYVAYVVKSRANGGHWVTEPYLFHALTARDACANARAAIVHHGWTRQDGRLELKATRATPDQLADDRDRF